MEIRAIPDWARKKTRHKWVDGNTITLLENGQAYFPALLAELDNARREVLLQTYIFAPDTTGRRITDALMRAAARGVTVRVLVDGVGGLSFIRELMDELRAAGVEVLIFRRELRPLSVRRPRLRRMHRKLVVIDGRVAFVGGINIIDDFGAEAPTHPRYDYAVRVEGALLDAILTASRHLWRMVAWASLRYRARGQRPQPAETQTAGQMRAAFLVRDNLRHRNDIESAYLDAIAKARDEIIIANAYFFPGIRFRRALLAAVSRGVKITLLLQGVADHPLIQYATRALYPLFLEKGIRLFEYQRSMLHAKVAVIDSHWATVGSSNIDPLSLTLAREANVVVDDAGFAATLKASLRAAMRDGARELRREEWAQQSLMHRALCWLAYQTIRLATGLAGYRAYVRR
ncbi:MAG: cardiolipin synthase ClsB [Azoarcus sp.]|jgi:cardiolipin synthase|nr:cardiolipin synthase ClsB [Azoarcus sp.]